MFGGSLMSRGGKSGVPASASPARCNREPLSCLREVAELLSGLRVITHGAYRDRQLDRLAVPARPIAALAMTPPLRRIFRVVSKVKERVVVGARLQYDIAAAAPVAAARTAPRNELFAT